MTWKTAIENRMASKGISKAELSRMSGLSKGYISDLLNNDEDKRKKGLSMEAAEKIAKALGTNGPNLWKEAKK